MRINQLSGVIIALLIILQLNRVFAQVESKYDSLVNALTFADNVKEKSDILLNLSKELEGESPHKSIRYAQEAYDIAIANDLHQITVASLIQLAITYSRISDYKKAIELAETALEMSKKLQLSDDMILAKSTLSIIYFELGDFEKSANFSFEILEYHEKTGNKKQIGITLGNIGIDFISQGNFQKGMGYLKNSLDVAISIHDAQGMAYQYNNIAAVYSEYFNDYAIALDYFKKASQINTRLNDKRQQGIYFMNIGSSLYKLHEFDSVLYYFNNANRLFREINNQNLISECHALIGEYYKSIGDLETSILHADTALGISKQNEFLEITRMSAGLLHQLFLLKSDTNRAYRYAMIEDKAKDSLSVLKNQKELYKLEFQYNFEKMDKVRQIARQKKETLFIVVIISLISGLMILLLLYSRHRIKTKNISLEKQNIERELSFKNKELSINLISLIRKNDMLSDISKKLVEIGKGAKKEETKEAITKINRELRNSADDKMLKEFTLRFQEVHKDFYESLLRKFPELTPNELKLCAFLRLNMSTKEISELTGQRILTIDHARYRLRKKLGISNADVNLITFLHQI